MGASTLASSAWAAILVEYKPVSSSTYTVIATVASGTGVTIIVPDNGPGHYRVRAQSPASEDIGRIRFTTSNPSNQVQFIVAGPPYVFPDPFTQLTPAGRHWAGFETNCQFVAFQASVTGDLVGSIASSTGASGQISIARIDCRDVLADIEYWYRIGFGFENLVAEDLAAGASIRIKNGTLGRLQLSGNLLGLVEAVDAAGTPDLGDIVVTGNIGQSPSVRAIIRSRNGIDQISAANIYADITANAFNNGPTGGTLESITTTGSPGEAYGTFTATDLSGFESRIKGDFHALLQLGAAVSGGGLPFQGNKKIIIDKSLASDGILQFSTPSSGGGLTGQVVIAASTVGSWLGTVRFGSSGQSGHFVLPGPFYINLASTFGGGAVGWVRFNMHGADCLPPNGSNPAFAPAPTVLNLRHYGEIKFLPITNKPVRVSRRPVGAAAWSNQASCFTVVRNSTNKRQLDLTPSQPLQNGFEYRIESIVGSPGAGETVLQCDIPGAASPPAVLPYTYTFQIGNDCPWDPSGDGTTGLPDNAIVINNWGAAGCGLPGDVDDDGAVGLGDIAALIQHWDTTCPAGFGGGEGLMMAGASRGATVAEVLDSFGHDSLESFARYLATLPTQQASDLLDAFNMVVSAAAGSGEQ